MRKVVVVLWFIISLFVFSAGAFARTEIVFPKGTGLERCVRDNLFQPFLAPVFEEDALTLTALSCEGDNITSLEGIEAFTNLQSVDFGYKGTAIDNLTPLAGLGKLTRINISRSNISDISPLAGLPLVHLDLSDNHITDLTPLAEITTLSTLVLYHQSPDYITDISPLDNLTALNLLDLEANKITDINPLRNMKRLRYLHLKDNRLTSIEPLADINTLELVNLSLNALTDLTPLTSSKGITTLYADANRITSIDFLSELTNITHISLNRNRVSDLSPLGGLAEPKYLSFDMNYITDIEVLRIPMSYRKITYLSLAYNCVEDFNSLPLYFIKEAHLLHQCQPHPLPSAFDLATVVNGDLLEAISSEEIEEDILDKAAPTGPGGCSLAKDADLLLLMIPLIFMLIFLRGKMYRNKQ
jgi:Leucine-rich repeat (LRR) protein